MPLPIVYEIMVDWDMTDWADVPDFSEPIDDISADVCEVNWVRGEEREEGNSPAATLELRIKGSLYEKYSVYNQYGDLYGLLLPYRIIRVRAFHNGTPYNEFLGFISKIKVNPDPDAPEVYIYCTDGLDLLARNVVTQDWGTRTIESDGAAVGEVLDAAGWSSTRRSLDTDGETLQYPQTTSYIGV